MNKILSHLIYNDNLVFTFIRAQLSSAFSAVIDLGTRVLCYSLLFVSLSEFYRSNISVAIGAILGGVVQCVVNYKFTFNADGLSAKSVAVKFLVVWGGNILLNMYGTTYLLGFISNHSSLFDGIIGNDLLFTVTTFLVAITVSVIWNFPMQKYFVYRNLHSD